MVSDIRSSRWHRAVRRTGTCTAATLVLVLLGGVAPGVAGATPPSDTEIADARAAADAVAARIGALTGELVAAQDRVAAAQAAAAIAMDGFQATQAAYTAAEERARGAAEAAAAAAAELEVARGELVAFARRSYMSGSSWPGAASLITSSDVGELVERAALLEAAGEHRSAVLLRVTALQEQAARADAEARTALAEAESLRAQAATALDTAQEAARVAREQAAALAIEQAGLQAALAAAEQELAAVVGERAAADRAAAAQAAARPATPARPAPVRTPVRVPVPAGSGSASVAGAAVDAALTWLGTPYAWGGGGSRGPGYGFDVDEGVFGFDCSGLTQHAYAQAGIGIPRNSRAQFAALPPVAVDDLRPGDLVFWATDPSDPATIHHVAIYLGADRIVEAPQSGDVVKVAPMRWGGYAGAVRPSA